MKVSRNWQIFLICLYSLIIIGVIAAAFLFVAALFYMFLTGDMSDRDLAFRIGDIIFSVICIISAVLYGLTVTLWIKFTAKNNNVENIAPNIITGSQ